MKPRFVAAFVLAAACGSSPPAPKPAAPVVQAPPPAPPAPAGPSASGIWLGSLPGAHLRIQLHLELGATPHCALDSVDQGAAGIPCTVSATGTAVKIDVPVVHGTLEATLSADGNTLDGTWTQGQGSPLVLTRQAAAIAVVKPDVMPPVDLASLQAVLDKDLAEALATGDLAPGTGGGVVIGVVQRGVRKIFAYGAAKPDSLFEIGSVSKTFTGLLLAQLVEQNKVKLDEPVRALLPKGTVAAPAAGPEITLLDLSAQHSGLPRMPDNFKPADGNNPYVDYDKKALFAYLGGHGLALPEGAKFEYSNLGVGLLGEALSLRAGTSYAELLRKEITGPLGMRDTVVTLTPALKARFLPGHNGKHEPVHAWEFDALVGAGGIRSTAGDMLTYLEAQLHPDRLPRTVTATPQGKTLAAAIAASHVVHGESMPGMHIALNWMQIDASGAFWHNGATAGFSSFAVFDPKADLAIVVLNNTSIEDGGFADALAAHVGQRLLGLPARSLAPAR